MQETQIRTTVSEVFSQILDRKFEPETIIVREKTASWDSLKHMEIVFALESEFGVEFTVEQIGEIQTSDDFVSLLSQAHAA